MKGLIEAGMNIARVNAAFADPDEMDRVRKLVHDISDEVALMIDIKGPEVRLNKFPKPIDIEVGDDIIIGNTNDCEIYPSNYDDLYKSLEVGQRMVVGDGDVELELKEIEGDKMHCEVVLGRLLKPGKALNLPGADYSSTVLTEKDKERLGHGMKTGWEMVSASFISDKESAQEVRDFMGDSEMRLIAKIENQEGVDNIDDILEIVDGIMIARGGLGVEIGLERVNIAQRILTKKAAEAGKPSITATQMLESMIENSRPTRAEASDVTTAVLLGSDAMMTSAETTTGKYPVDAVKFLRTATLEAEKYVQPKIVNAPSLISQETDAITKAAAEVCINMSDKIDAVLVVSKTGRTAGNLGRHGISQPIYAFASNDFYKRAVMLYKGINRAFVYEGIENDCQDYDRDIGIQVIVDLAKEKGVIESGQTVLFLGRPPMGRKEFFPNIFEIVKVE